MKWVQIKIDPTDTASLDSGWIDPAGVDATTEKDLARQAAEDEDDAIRDAARYARRVRRRLGLSQVEFSERIHVPLETIRNWEQGKRSPTGAAKALLKVLDKAPEAALAALR
jgi:putative transcriptional regulator